MNKLYELFCECFKIMKNKGKIHYSFHYSDELYSMNFFNYLWRKHKIWKDEGINKVLSKDISYIWFDNCNLSGIIDASSSDATIVVTDVFDYCHGLDIINAKDVSLRALNKEEDNRSYLFSTRIKGADEVKLVPNGENTSLSVYKADDISFEGSSCSFKNLFLMSKKIRIAGIKDFRTTSLWLSSNEISISAVKSLTNTITLSFSNLSIDNSFLRSTKGNICVGETFDLNDSTLLFDKGFTYNDKHIEVDGFEINSDSIKTLTEEPDSLVSSTDSLDEVGNVDSEDNLKLTESIMMFLDQYIAREEESLKCLKEGKEEFAKKLSKYLLK